MDTPVPENGGKAEDQLRLANEKLYEHSLELATRNKTLSLLRQLYQISIITLDPDTLSDKVVHIIREALEFEMVCIYGYDSNKDQLTPMVISRSERLENVVGAEHPFQSHVIEEASKHPFLNALLQGEPNHSKDLHDLWAGTMTEHLLKEAVDGGHIKTILAYPLRIDGKMTDILVMCFNRNYDDLTKFELESLESIIDVAAVALDRARVYKELQHLNEELTSSNRQQVALIHFITHQLKGFVAKSRNIFSMIQEGDFGPVPEQMKPMIDEGFTSSTKGAQTIQEILNAANIKSGQVTYANMPFGFKAILNTVITSLKRNAEARGLALAVNEPSEEVILTGDQMQMENALKNLIDNSIKYTLSGSITITLTKEKELLRLVVADTGVGITEEDMKRLFTEGGHGAESQKVNVDSTGFGLYIVKKIVEAHKGTVWAESEGAGKGSRFIVELPIS